VNLTQLIETIHNICKVQGSNIDHHTKKQLVVILYLFNKIHFFFTMLLIYSYNSTLHEIINIGIKILFEFVDKKIQTLFKEK